MFVAILGSQPTLSLAELESLYGPSAIVVSSDTAALIEAPKMLPIARLGGVQKLATVEAQLSNLHPSTLIRAIKELLVPAQQSSKLNLGISFYGHELSLSAQKRLSSELKHEFKAAGKSLRMVPNRTSALSTATVYHNKLTGKGVELIIVKIDGKLLLARTLEVQNINAYAKRDRGRPKRDARVGMLPPKLAQIMINLAQPQSTTIYDPFCGTGVVLQEGLLAGLKIEGSDISERMVAYTKENLEWLEKFYLGNLPDFSVSVADARSVKLPNQNVSLVSETYLGPPLKQTPSPDVLKRIVSEVDSLLFKTLKNLGAQLASGSRHCMAVPAWHIRGRNHSLPLIDQIPRLGYNLVTFKSVNGSLIYRRPQSIVGRQLLVLEKK